MDIYDELADLVSSVSVKVTQDVNLEAVLDFENEKTRALKRIESLTAKLHTDCKTAKEKISSLEKERANVRKEVTKVKVDNTAVSKKITKLEAEIKDVQYKINRTNQISNITQKEREVLNRNEEELHAYKAFTGIRWNFNTPDNILEGLITNSQNNFVKAFQLERTVPNKKIRETLWNYIKEAASESWSQGEDNKENEIQKN